MRGKKRDARLWLQITWAASAAPGPFIFSYVKLPPDVWKNRDIWKFKIRHQRERERLPENNDPSQGYDLAATQQALSPDFAV